MGPGDEIAHNARNLSIDLAAVDLAAISHGHYDHGGGLATFLSLNTTAPFYTGHCTGSEAYERLAIRMGGILHPCNTGDNIIV